MHQLGRVEKVTDLRLVWAHEAQDFSRWLSEQDNLALLGETVGIDLILEERESPVGSFSVDLFAREEGSDRRIIIENQLEDTNHDHLGKIITYAAGKNAEVVIWIVKRARDEHRQAVAWLNQHTDEDVAFFLIEMELWRIGDSPLAPVFNVVEKPNDWTKAMRAVEGLTGTQQLQLAYWQAFVEHAFAKPEFAAVFSRRKPRASTYYDLSVGSSAYNVDMSINTQAKLLSVGIYIRDSKGMLYPRFLEHREQIEAQAGMPLQWREAKKDCHIVSQYAGDVGQEEDWPRFFDWQCAMALKMRDICKTYGS